MAGFRSDHNIMKDYITAMDGREYENLAESMVAVLVTHSNLSAKHLDIRFDLHTTIEGVKERLHKHIGTPAMHQRLIHKIEGRVVQEMSDNSRMLGFYSVESGHEIHIIDTDPFSLSRGGGLTDVSLVEKYRMSDEDYGSRKGTIREFLAKKRKDDPKYKLKPGQMQKGLGGKMQPVAPTPEPQEIPGPESVEGITVGARCQIMPGKRRGVVRFVGDAEQLKAGPWVGVQLDEPLGSNNGTIKGLSFFECGENFGAFCRGKNVVVGDFPVKDLMDSDEDEEEEKQVGDSVDENADPSEQAGAEKEEEEDEI